MNLNKIIGLFISFWLLSYAGIAQNSFSISGVITDSISSENLIGANVILADSNGNFLKGVSTSNNGKFQIKNIEQGDYQIKVSYIGYISKLKPLYIDENQDINFNLLPHNNQLMELKILSKKNTLFGLSGTGSLIGKEAIRLAKPIGTQEILEKVAGINGFSDDGMSNSRISIGIRGIPPRRSARVMILEDGIPIQPAIYTYSSMYYNPPIERISEIEVLKGSGAIEYGPLTMGGVINYITSEPRSELGGRATVTVGENGYLSSFFEIGGWGKKSIKPEIQLLYKRGDGYRDNNSFEQYNATVKFRINPDSSEHNYYIKLNTNYENSNATYTGLTEYSFATNPNFNSKEYDNFKVFRTSFDLIHTRYKKNGNLYQDKIYANYFDRDWWRENDLFYKASEYISGNAEPVDFLTNGDLIRAGAGESSLGIMREFYVGGYERTMEIKHRFFKVDPNATFKVGGRLHYEYFGNDIRRGAAPDSREGTALYLDPATGDTLFVGTSESYNTYAGTVFIKENIHIGKLTIDAGLRMENYFQEYQDNFSSLNENAFQTLLLPGIGFNYAFEKSELFAGIHKGFTPASRSSLLVVGSNTGSDKLLPETSWNSELGYRLSNKWVSFEVAGYYLMIRDMLNVSRSVNITNVDRIDSRGIENNFTFKFSELVKVLPDLSIVYTYLNTNVVSGVIEESALYNGSNDVTGNKMPYAPEHTLVLSLNKNIGNNFIIGGSYKYVSKSYTDIENIEYTFNRGDTGPIPEYWLFDASIRYRLKMNWAFDITAKNIFDHIYIGSRLHSSPGNKDASLSSGIMPGARRQINISVTYTF